jgi:hypothetical protein
MNEIIKQAIIADLQCRGATRLPRVFLEGLVRAIVAAMQTPSPEAIAAGCDLQSLGDEQLDPRDMLAKWRAILNHKEE